MERQSLSAAQNTVYREHRKHREHREHRIQRIQRTENSEHRAQNITTKTQNLEALGSRAGYMAVCEKCML